MFKGEGNHQLGYKLETTFFIAFVINCFLD